MKMEDTIMKVVIIGGIAYMCVKGFKKIRIANAERVEEYKRKREDILRCLEDSPVPSDLPIEAATFENEHFTKEERVAARKVIKHYVDIAESYAEQIRNSHGTFEHLTTLLHKYLDTIHQIERIVDAFMSNCASPETKKSVLLYHISLINDSIKAAEKAQIRAEERERFNRELRMVETKHRHECDALASVAKAMSSKVNVHVGNHIPQSEE